MTLPISVTLPLDRESIISQDPERLYDYLKALIYNLSIYIQQTNAISNGQVTVFTESDLSYFFIQGSGTQGTATYTNTILRVCRINLIIYVFFDITWTGHTGTGDLLIQSPFKAVNIQQFPFVGTVEADSMNFDAGYTYLTLNIEPNTNTIAVNQNGSGQPLIALPLTANGHLRGSITYAGNIYS